MFSQFLTILTCLAMLWHSIGGCCWHHDHRECDATGALGEPRGQHHEPDVPLHRHAAHDHHAHHQTPDEEPVSPAPCNHSRHCTEDGCVYVKSFTPDMTSLFPSQAEFVMPVIDLLAAQASATLRTTDRFVLHREELSAQHHCAQAQSWLL